MKNKFAGMCQLELSFQQEDVIKSGDISESEQRNEPSIIALKISV